MSESQNTIENMSLNINIGDRYSSVVSERNLYSFAQGALLKTIDEVLNEVDIDENVEIDLLALDLKIDGGANPLDEILKSLREE